MSVPEDPKRSAAVSRRDFLSSIAAMSAVGVGACRITGTVVHPGDSSSLPDDISRVVAALKRSIPRTMARQDIPGLSIALTHRGALAWAEGFGFTDREQRVPVRVDTQFSVGSISKSFTALGVLRAVEEGLLSLDEPLLSYLPWFTLRGPLGPSAAPTITLRHLLSHHSGLGTWPPLGNPYDADYHARTFGEVVRSARASWLKFMPGERFEYSNQGIDLAGAALEAVRGRPFVLCMHDDVLRPLGMSASTFDQAKVTEQSSYAAPYMGRRRVPIRDGIVHPMLAAGGMISTAMDLVRFLALHRDEGVIAGRSWVGRMLLSEMYTPQLSAREQPTGYGLAIYKAVEHDTIRYSHGGLGFGISAHYRWLPEHDFGVVVLSNQDNAHNAPAIAGEAVALMLGRDSRTGSPQRRTAAAAARAPGPDGPAVNRSPRIFAGSYLLYEGVLETFEADDALLYHIRGRQRRALRAEGADTFSDDGRRYTFVSDAMGRVKGVRFADAGYDVATAENSVVYLARNDAPTDPRGPDRPEWAVITGQYSGTFIGAPALAELTVKNGYLYLNRTMKLTAVEPGHFVTADNEEVRLDGQQLFVGTKRYVR